VRASTASCQSAERGPAEEEQEEQQQHQQQQQPAAPKARAPRWWRSKLPLRQMRKTARVNLRLPRPPPRRSRAPSGKRCNCLSGGMTKSPPLPPLWFKRPAPRHLCACCSSPTGCLPRHRKMRRTARFLRRRRPPPPPPTTTTPTPPPPCARRTLLRPPRRRSASFARSSCTCRASLPSSRSAPWPRCDAMPRARPCS
jgi:hypothetical protein